MALARWQATIVDEAGNVQPAASVEVRAESVGTPLASVFSDRDGAVPLGNPFPADGEGFAAFHVAGGAYRITATLGGFSRIWRYVAIGTAAEHDFTDSPILVEPVVSGFVDFAEIAEPDAPSANTARGFAVDDGAGVTTLAIKDSDGNVSPLSHFKQDGTGAVSRSFYNRNLWRVDAADYGDVATDAQGAINRAIVYANSVGGGEVRLDARSYALAGAVVIRTGVRLIGKGPEATRLILDEDANTAVLETLDFATLLGTNSLGGPEDFALVDMTFDGNGLDQDGAGTEINGLSLYGFRYLIENVTVENAKRQGVRAEWGQFGDFPMETTIRRLKIDTCGRHGLWWRGPHDTYGENITIVDAGQETDDAYDGFLLEGFGNGRWVDVHPWHRSTSTNRMANSLRCEQNGNDFVVCNFEGGRRCVYLAADDCSFEGCFAYANFGTDPMVVLRGNHNRISLKIDSSDTDVAPCVQIGDGSGGLFNSHLDLTCVTTATNAIVITDDDGRNTGTIKTIGSTNGYSGDWAADSPVLVQRPDGYVEEWAGAIAHAIGGGALVSGTSMIIAVPIWARSCDFLITGLSHNSGTAQRPQVQISIDGGATYITTSTYGATGVDAVGPAVKFDDTALISVFDNLAAARGWDIRGKIDLPIGGLVLSHYQAFIDDDSHLYASCLGQYMLPAGERVTHLRVNLNNTGSFDNTHSGNVDVRFRG